jgi:hypothetical protein
MYVPHTYVYVCKMFTDICSHTFVCTTLVWISSRQASKASKARQIVEIRAGGGAELYIEAGVQKYFSVYTNKNYSLQV